MLSFAVAAGCQKPPAALAPPKPPEVIVGRATVQEVIDHEEFTGRTEASETVEVRARVTGYLDKVHFNEGAMVKKGELLFTIDPRQPKAELERAEANVAQAEARVTRLEADFKRIDELPKGSVSQQEYDKVVGDLTEARAAVKSAAAARNVAKLTFDFTKVTASIGGRISRRLIDPGNTVKADETALTYIASMEPMYAYFDVDERTYLRIYRLFLDKGITLAQLREMSADIRLADEQGYPHKGKINFVDNRVDPNTGSVWVRAVVPNPKSLLTPGLFIRVRVPVGDPHKAVLVPESALAPDQGQKFVYIINTVEVKDEATGEVRKKQVATFRHVEVGAQHRVEVNGRVETLREIVKGVAEGDRVITKGVQRVRPGAEVEPKEEVSGNRDQGTGVRSQ